MQIAGKPGRTVKGIFFAIKHNEISAECRQFLFNKKLEGSTYEKNTHR